MDESASFLMEKLRAKGGTYKAFKEYSKSLRMTLLEKRYALEITEKNYLQECLDLLQQSIRVSTLPAIIERLEVISRHLGLKFMSGPSRLEWFISSDMFYVEVVLESNGHIKDVKIHHDGTADQQSCEEMKGTLENRDFKDFTLQLEGLISIYNLNADKIIKSQAFTSLQFLEADVAQLFELQSSYTTDPFDIIHKSDVGFVQKRRGGHPMKIIYFISPYDLLDITKNTYKPLTMDVPDVDYSVSLCLESSSTNKLQTKSLVKVLKSEKMDEDADVHTPSAVFDDLTSSNSNSLPACFIMKLKERTPICVSIINQIKEITDIEVNKTEGPLPILSLIKREILSKHSDCEEDNNIVTLPDQRHCYVMTDSGEMFGYVVQSIPFVHPSQISRILHLLRQQALFNSFIASCIRPRTIKDTNNILRRNVETSNHTNDNSYKNGFGLKLFGSEDFRNLSIFNEVPSKPTAADVIMFEVIPLSLQQITVSFEHPNEETLLTADLDLSDISNLRCNISSASEDSITSVTSAQEYAARALQRSFSIPATMRALMRLWESLSETSDEEDLNESSTNNDVADLHENVENKMITESSKENGECAPMEFSNGVPIKLEKSDSGENSLDGFSLASRAADFNAEEMFSLPNPAHGFPATFDVDMPPAMAATATSASSNGAHNFDVPPIFLDNANEQTGTFAAAAAAAAVVKPESADFVENAFFRNKSASDLFAAKPGAIVIDSSSDSEPADANKETLADAKEPSPGSTSSEFSALTEMSADLPSHHEKPPLTDFEMDPGMMEMNNLEDVQQFLKLTESKLPKNGNGNTLTSSSSVLPDHVLPNFNLNAVASLQPSMTAASQGGATSSVRGSTDGVVATPSLPPSTTITRIPAMKEGVDEAVKSERKKLKNSDDKVRIEKTKKKRKRDDSPMGPPEKFRVKTDPLPKSLSVSVKPVDASGTPRSPSPSSAFRKYTMSPTQAIVLGKVSPNSSTSSVNNNTIKKSAMVASPGLSGSPKMGVSSVSPKQQSVTSSPKSVSSGGSGKPSMSALKSAVTSPSSGSSKSNNELKKSYKDSSGRENKEKKSSNGGSGNSAGHQSPKPKSAQTKLKQVEMGGSVPAVSSPQYEGLSAANLDPKVVLTQAKSAGKKMCLASVIDKLNKQQEDKCNNGNGGNGGGKSCSPTLKDGKSGGQDAKSSQATKVSNEYMIKQHSSDGIKMTISNKSRKEQNMNKLGGARNSIVTGSGGSPKHGNLKPNPGSVIICKKSKSASSMSGNNLGGISKHSSSKVISSSGGSSSNSSAGTSGSGGGGSGGSSGNSGSSSSSSSSSFKSSKSNHSPKTMHSVDPNRSSSKEKIRPSKTHSDKSIFSTPKRSSPSLQQESGEGEKPSYKTQPPYQPAVVFSKPLDTNFQIPKISDRNKMTPGEGEASVKKCAEGPSGMPGSADVEQTVKTTDTISPVKVPAFLNTEDCKVTIDSVKSGASNVYEAKTKSSTMAPAGSSTSSLSSASSNENSLDVMAGSASSQHQLPASCSLTSTVQQSSDSIKVNL